MSSPALRASTLIVVTLSASMVGCPAAEQHSFEIGGVLPLLAARPATGLMIPIVDQDTWTLGAGWSIPREDAGDPMLYRVLSSPAEVSFWWAAEADAVLTAELRPVGESPVSSVTVSVNKGEVATERLTGRWQELRVRIPESALRLGLNHLVFQFEGAEGVRTVARFRELELRSGLGRRPWRPTTPVVGPADASVPGDQQPGAAAVDSFAMSTDSLLDFAIRARGGARLVGEIYVVGRGSGDRRESAGDQLEQTLPPLSGVIHLRIEQLLANRDVVSLFEHRAAVVEAGGAPAEKGDVPAGTILDVPVSVGPDGLARIRLRVWGDVNGRVVWRGLRMVSSGPVEVAGASAQVLPAPSSGVAGRPDVVVVLLDAGRADAVSAYGAARSTPALDAIARDGTRFDRAYSAAPWTGPSVASLLTGHYADAHGSDAWNRRLSKLVPALAQILADAGYRTVLWSQHLAYTGNPTLRRGFEEIVASPYRERHLLPDAALLFDDDRPTFALVHLLLPHAPYEPPAPHRGTYTHDASQQSDITIDVSPEALRALHGADPDVRAIDYARARYDETMRWADSQVGRLVEAIDAEGHRDDLLLVVTSDHGEAFFEHGRFLHTRNLYEELIQIPLLIRWPASVEGHREVVDDPVSLVDLAPTIVDALGVADPRASFQGTSLIPAVFGSGLPSRPVHAATRIHEWADHRPSPLAAIIRYPLKAVLHEPTGILEVYDLEADPRERADVWGADPVRDQVLLQSILMLRARSAGLLGRRSDQVMDPELQERLRALGYIR